MKKQKPKMYIIKKYIKARSAIEAIRKDKTHPVDDCWVDEDWQKGQKSELASAIGFITEHKNEIEE